MSSARDLGDGGAGGVLHRARLPDLFPHHRRAGATNALLVTFLIPVSAILLGIVLLDETVEPRQLAGMAAIAIGVAAIDGRPARFIARMSAAARIREFRRRVGLTARSARPYT